MHHFDTPSNGHQKEPVLALLDAEYNPGFLNGYAPEYASGFQWAFACLYNDDAERITIVKMMAASQVKENIFKQVELVLEFWDRLKKIV